MTDGRTDGHLHISKTKTINLNSCEAKDYDSIRSPFSHCLMKYSALADQVEHLESLLAMARKKNAQNAEKKNTGIKDTAPGE